MAAAGLVRKGAVFDLGIPFDDQGPQPGGARINPVHLMSQTGDTQVFPGGFRYADDYIFMPLQGASQWTRWPTCTTTISSTTDFRRPTSPSSARSTTPSIGSPKELPAAACCSTSPGCAGVDWLEAGEVITPDDLEAAIAAQDGVEVGSGDILLFRTGWRRMFLEQKSAQDFMAGEPGLGQDCCEWLHERGVAAVCSDNWAIEVLPGEVPDVVLNVHMVLIRDMGLTLGEILDFEELAADCMADGVWEFFFCAPPLKVTRGVGSPINPLAIK